MYSIKTNTHNVIGKYIKYYVKYIIFFYLKGSTIIVNACDEDIKGNCLKISFSEPQCYNL